MERVGAMRITVERLRVLLVTGAAALVLVLAGFVALAHYRAHRFLHNLPARLGADIEKETNDYTYSQAVGGRTIFTLHAARALQHRDGKVALHDVGIVLYGREQNRVDRIYGKEFEYDQKNGVVRAMGEVHLDLQAPAPTDARARAAYAAGSNGTGSNAAGHGGAETDPELVHALTSGLVYEQRLGTATTTEPVEFTYRGMTGRARGATYAASSGLVTLDHEVRLSGLRGGRPMLLTADHAVLTKASGLLVLNGARYVSVGETRNGGNARAESTAGLLRVSLRADGTPERAEGSDGVSVESGMGVLRAPRATVEMTAAGLPAAATMSGGLSYTMQDATGDASGRGDEGSARFTERGGLATMRIKGGVVLHTRTRSSAGAAWESERDIRADQVNFRLVDGRGGRRVPEEAIAEGAARVVLTDTGRAGRQGERSEIGGDRLTARFDNGAGKPRLSSLAGEGRTVLERHADDGASDRSAGDRLEMRFVPAAMPAQRERRAPARTTVSTEIADIVQRGSVTLRHTSVGKDGKTESLDGSADEVQYDGSDRLLLRGNARLNQSGSDLRAGHIALARSSGEGTAEGSVQVSYAQPNGGDEMHVIGDHAAFSRDGGDATFHGAAGRAARMWQGGSQIVAPTLVLRRKEGALEAFGAGGSEQVHTVLSEAAKAGEAKGAAPARALTVLRVTSRRLAYSDAAHRADFTGGVLIESKDGSLGSDRAVAMLRDDRGRAGPMAQTGQAGQAGQKRPATAARREAAAAGGLLPAGGLDRVVASGAVVVKQPGREARGEQAVYTAADGLFTLTGTPGALPTVTDAANGTVRGTVIRFGSGDNSVVVSGDPAQGDAGRVRSEMKVKTD